MNGLQPEPTRSDIMSAIGRMEGRLGNIEDTTKQTHKAIYGNGSTSDSLVSRMAKVEEALESGVNLCTKNERAISDLASMLGDLTKGFASHVGTFHIGKAIRNKWFWGLLVVVALIVHAFFELGMPWVLAFLKWAGFPIPA